MSERPQPRHKALNRRSVLQATGTVVAGTVVSSGTALGVGPKTEYKGVAYDPTTMEPIGPADVRLDRDDYQLRGLFEINGDEFPVSKAANPRIREVKGLERATYSASVDEESLSGGTTQPKSNLKIIDLKRTLTGYIDTDDGRIAYLVADDGIFSNVTRRSELLHPNGEQSTEPQSSDDEADITSGYDTNDTVSEDYDGDLIGHSSIEYENEGIGDETMDHEFALGTLGEENPYTGAAPDEIAQYTAEDWYITCFFPDKPTDENTSHYDPVPEDYTFWFEPVSDITRRDGMHPSSLDDDTGFHVETSLSMDFVSVGPFSFGPSVSYYETEPEEIDESYDGDTQAAKWTLEADRFPENQEEAYAVKVGVRDNGYYVGSSVQVPIEGQFGWTQSVPGCWYCEPYSSTEKCSIYPMYYVIE